MRIFSIKNILTLFKEEAGLERGGVEKEKL